jgi:hypothetical protein
MKRLIFALAAALAWAGPAFAGDYHQSTTLRCSQCHTMHASRTHAFNGEASGSNLWELPTPGEAHDKLLVKAGVNETCLACHDAQAQYPDVLGELNAYGATANQRSAGFLSRTNIAAVGTHTTGHTLDSGLTPPGYTGSWDPGYDGFHCGNCHSVHGSPAYRNLGQSMYMGSVDMTKDAGNPFYQVGPTYNAFDAVAGNRGGATFDGTQDVYITALSARSYKATEVKFGAGPATSPGGMNQYCAVCHGDFHGASNTQALDTVNSIRHPTTGVFANSVSGGFAHTAALQTALTSTAGATTAGIVRPAWRSGADGEQYEAACLSCHKGHGNKVGYALIIPGDNAQSPTGNFESGDGAVASDAGDGLGAQYPMRNLCNACHPMGR